MNSIDKTKPVLVTGATGYVAGWLVKKLMEEGIHVHAAVRNPDNKKKTKHLDDIAAKSSGTITYFKSDLLEEGSYEEAIKGCEVVFHTASPFSINVEDPQRDLVDPALNGTRNVLNSVNKVDTVKRVVLTSSCAAIYTDASECAQYPNGEITEEIWNTTASLDYQPYSYSKTVAEKEAWSIAGSQDKWKLVVVNPSFVMGPFLNPEATTSESFNVLKQIGDGTLKQGAPRMAFGFVDVRDLAVAHFNAAYLPDANGRNIISGHNSDLLEVSKMLHKSFGENYPIPNKSIPKWLIWLIGPLVDKKLDRTAIKNNVNHKWKANNSKSKKELNMSYRPLEETMTEAFQGLIDAGVFKK